MNVQTTPIESLVPYLHNNRVHSETQIARIARSIKEFGFNQPIVIDESNEILVGHGRLLAAQQLGLKTVPCLRVERLSDAQKRAYRILDNKLQNDSSWNFDALRLEIDDLVDLEFPVKEWGLDELLGVAEDEPIELTEESESLSTGDATLIKRGDVIALNEHLVHCEDSTVVEIAAKLDMVITDPPYGVKYTGKTEDALTLENDDLDEESLRALWMACLDNLLPSLKDGGVIYATVPPGPLREVFSSELKRRGILRQELVWLKDSMVLGHSDYHYIHEPILYGWKPGAAHFITADRSKTSVLLHDRPKRSEEHPTMKPISLWGELIQNSSRKGETVFDPFLGSGTTLIACDSLGRKCIGSEIDPKYCEVIVRRFKSHCENEGKSFKCLINGQPYQPESSV